MALKMKLHTKILWQISNYLFSLLRLSLKFLRINMNNMARIVLQRKAVTMNKLSVSKLKNLYC